EHLRVRVELELKEVAQGCDRVINLTRQDTCPECDGSGAKAGSKPVPCGDCGGRGQRVQQQGFFRMQVACPSCRGAGEVIRDRCAKCSGQVSCRVRLMTRSQPWATSLSSSST
ncbi:MAG: zinc finger domain-containing protein, partial [Planctomycetaceae bacterium]